MNAEGIKGDWCDTRGLDEKTCTDDMAAAINATGKAVWFNFHCAGAWADWCAADGPSSRISHDHSDSWQWTLTSIAGLVEAAPHAGAQPGGGFWWPDPDFLTAGGESCAANRWADCISHFRMGATRGKSFFFFFNLSYGESELNPPPFPTTLL